MGLPFLDRIAAEARHFLAQAPGAVRSLRLATQESVALAEVQREEVTRANGRFGGMLAPSVSLTVAAIPTTSAKYLLWNGESLGGRSYVLEHAHPFLFSGGAVSLNATLFAAVTPSTIADLSGNAGTSVFAAESLSGGVQSSKAKLLTNATPFTIGASAWAPMTSLFNATTAAVGLGRMPGWTMGGALIVPPGCGVGFAVLDTAASSPIWYLGLRWAEVFLDLE